MLLAEYLASEQAREDVRELFDGDKPSLPVMSMEDLCLVRDEVGAWRSVMIWDDHQNKELTAYYRPDGDRYVVTDLGEGVRALRLSGASIQRLGDAISEVLGAMWIANQLPPRYGITGMVNGEIAPMSFIAAADLPDAICRVMLASLRVAQS